MRDDSHLRIRLPGLLIGTSLAILAACFPQQTRADAGPVTGFSFLQLEPSARAAALGGSLNGIYGDDVNAFFYNPALLNEQMHRSFSLSYLNYLHDVSAGFAVYSREVQGVGVMAAGIRFLTWGEIDGRDEQGQETENFGASDVALTIGVARPAGDGLTYGANVHFVRSNIASHNASAIAADAGVAYYVPGHGLTLSASVNNLGHTLNSLGTVADELPLDVRIAVSKRLQHVPLLLSLTAYNLNRLDDVTEDAGVLGQAMEFVRVGAEFQFSEAFQVRVGYNHRRHEQLKTRSRLDLAGFGAGFGIRLASVNVDYAFSSWSAAGNLHQFTVRTKL